MNAKLFYHNADFNTIFNKRLTPIIINDLNYKNKWKYMSQFEKLCWGWTEINNYALNTINKNPNAKLFYFENIFKSKDKYYNLDNLLKFL